MYAAIAKAMVRSSRMRNFPAHIPTSQSQRLPPQRREPASASTTQIDILYLSFILSDFFYFIPDYAIEEIRMNLIQAFSPPNKVRMSIPHPCGMGLK